jgi:ribose 5-phosphate isomerase B
MKDIIVLAADHNGVPLKSNLINHLESIGHVCIDLGPYDTNKKVDYVDYAFQLSSIISDNHLKSFKGILVCGTGVGMSIAANRYDKVRAALVHNIETAPKCREHNNTNVICLGSWLTNLEESIEILGSWLGTDYGEKRHVRRVEKLHKQDKSKIVFTNGVFDIIHTGHIELLNFAKSLGGKLVIALDSDNRVRKLKGINRPVNNQQDRKKVLESLNSVDEVIIFGDDDDELNTLRDKVSPNIIVKGGEWTELELRQRDQIPDNISIKIYPIKLNYSTTNVIRKIKELPDWKKIDEK